jgi:hypothetical protein
MRRNGWLIPLALVVALAQAELLAGSIGPSESYTSRSGGWRPVGKRSIRQSIISRTSYQTAYRAPTVAVDPPVAPSRSPEKASPFLGQWPQTAGQVWREYDLMPYTLQVNSTRRPEQAIIDWVLRETGEATWHGEHVAVLSASQARLRVFHEPSVQARVAEIVDRFTKPEVKQFGFRVEVMGVGSPDWRRQAYRLLRPVAGSDHGPQSWLLDPEDASLLMADLRGRRDVRVHGTPHLLVYNGQTATVNSTGQRSYVRQVNQRPGTWPGYQADLDTIDEGYVLEMSPLATVDGAYVDAIVKVQVDQVEKLRDVTVDVPSLFDPNLTTRLQVPQRAGYRMSERFHWPTNKVLVIGLGMVPSAAPADSSLLNFGASPREDLLVFIQVSASPGQLASQALRTGYRYRR